MNQIVEYSATEAGLAELRSRLKGVVYDVTTTAGMENARKDRRECVTLRTNLDKLRLELNADDQARIKARNEKARELETAISEIERPIDQQIKAEEERKEQIRLAKLEAERVRVARIRERISAIARAPVDAIGLPLVNLRELAASFTAHAPAERPDDYEELLDEATAVWARAGEQFAKLLKQSEENAAEQIRLAREREAFELEQRERAAERDKADREAKAERDRLDKEAADARALAQKEAKAKLDAENKRIADESAELRRKQEEAEANAAAARRERNDAINAKLAAFTKSMQPFVKLALEYRAAPEVDAGEILVELCELYDKSRRPVKRGPAAEAGAEARA